MSSRWMTVVLVSALAGCGGVVVETTPEGTSGSSSSGSSSSSSGGVPATCEPQAQGSGGASLQPICSDLAVMNVSDPVFVDDGGDGSLSAGESGTITVKLNEIAGMGFNFYPSVTFTSDELTIEDTGSAQFYAILPCSSMDATARVSFLKKPSTTPSTATVKAQVSALGLDCPAAPSISIPISVQ